MPRRLTLPRLLWTVLGVVVSVAAVYAVAAEVTRGKQPTPGAVVLIVLVAILSVPFHVYLHELGHLLGALSMRLPIVAISVLASGRTKARVVNRATVRLGLHGKDSHVRVAVSPEQPFARTRMIVMILAGPGVNFATAAGCSAAAGAVSPSGWRAVLLSIALAAGLFGIANLAPVSFGGQPRDGRLVLLWLTQPEGLRTSLMLDYLAWRAKTPGNRWRSFEDLRPAPDNPFGT